MTRGRSAVRPAGTKYGRTKEEECRKKRYIEKEEGILSRLFC